MVMEGDGNAIFAAFCTHPVTPFARCFHRLICSRVVNEHQDRKVDSTRRVVIVS